MLGLCELSSSTPSFAASHVRLLLLETEGLELQHLGVLVHRPDDVCRECPAPPHSVQIKCGSLSI